MASSYIYYFITSEWLVLVLLSQTLITFAAGRLIERQFISEKTELDSRKETITREERKQLQEKYRKKRSLIMKAGVSLVLITLIFLKYYNFFAETAGFVTRRFGISFPSLNLLLPIGLSFYSLQAVAYIMDVYHRKIKADSNLFQFMLFLSYFPQIVQGPIPRYKHLASQLYESHPFDFQRFCRGFQLIVWGYMKKMIVADRIMIPVDAVFDNPSAYKGMILFAAAAAYWFQLYADFSGGIDIARGISQILGIELELNFTQPYFAVSVEDFWRRWHKTLGAFMRDYVFYPLSLSISFSKFGKAVRKAAGDSLGKKIPPFLAMFIVYLLVGLWHGPQWKYAVFGIWNGLFIAGGILFTDLFVLLKNRIGIDENLFSWRLFQMFRTFVIISFGSFFSRAIGLKTAVSMIRSFLEKWYDFAFLTDGTLTTLGIQTPEWILLLIMALLILTVDYFHETGFGIRKWVEDQGVIFEIIVVVAAVMMVIILGVYGPGYDAARFIYQQF